MMNKYILCMCLSVVCASVSQILLKRSTFNKYSSVIREYLNPWVICGYGLLFGSMLLTVYAYSGMEFKNGPLIEALGNVFVPVMSFFAFKERLGLKKCLGICFIMSGIIVFYL